VIGTPQDPYVLADLFGVDLDNITAKTSGEAKAKKTGERADTNGEKASTNGQQPGGEPVNLALYPKVLKALETKTERLDGTGDCSVDAYRVLCACVDDGLTEAQGGWVLRRRDDLADWLDGNPAGELKRTWEKITENREDDFEKDVRRRLHDRRVNDEANSRFAIEKAGDAPPFDEGLLSEILARPEEPPFRIDGLLPSGSSMLVTAQRKTGKTTLMLNMGDSLLTGQPFLGSFGVRPISGRVAILNFEVTAQQLGRWAHEVDIDEDRLYQVNLRGRRNPFGHPDDRERLIELLVRHEVESLIVDPFGRAFTGTNQNDSGEVGAFLASLDQFKADSGVADLILTAHAGWDGERTRGSSVLEDWADSVVTSRTL